MTIEKKNLDLNYHPGDDFYNYANGGWLKNNPLPDEFSRYGTFDKLAEDNQKILKELIENASKNPGAEGSIPQKVGDFFKSGMDSDKIESFGFQPIIHDLKQIEKTESKDQLLSILYGFHTQSNPVLFHLFGSPDKKDSSMVIANLYQGGLGLTDVDYYISGDEKSKEIRKKYLEYIEDMLKLTGEESAGEKAKIILAFEKRLALHSMSRLERRDPHKTYHKMSLEELSGLCPQINWKKYFKECGLKISEINVSQPEFFKEIGEMLNDLQLNVWQLYSKWHVINNASPYLSSEFLNRNFEFYGKFLSGRKSLQPNWKRVLIAEDYALGEAIGQMFVEKYFPPAAKQRMLILVANLKAALELRIQKLDWMTSSTKKEALEKLKTMGVKIGYPDKWRDYSKLRISSENYFGNLKNARIHNFQYQMDKIG